MEYLVGINMKDSKWVRPYLLAMGAALQLLGQLIFTEKALDRQKALRQKALIAMDLLAGALAYGVSSVKNEYDEATRRNFLLTHGKKFISAARAKKLFRTGVSQKNMGAEQDDGPLNHPA